MISVSFAICCLVFLSIISIVYFSKKRIKNMDNKIFSILIILNLIGICIDVSGYFAFKALGVDNVLNIFISKIYLIYYISFIFCLTIYVYNISFKNLNKILKTFITIFAVLCTIVFILPISVTMKDNTAFSYGPSVNLGYVCVFGLTFAMIIILLINIKKIKSKKYMPIFAFVILTFLAFTIQKINPDIALLLLSNSVVTTLMYFTIENPDVKLINELNDNRVLIEKTNEEKSNFLFKMTAEVRHPIDYIYETSNSLLNETDPEKLSRAMSVINSSSKKVSYLINEVLNVSSIDIKKLKIVNTKYNFYNIISEIQARTNQENTKNIDIRYEISQDIPESLYGDAIKIKQIIMTILSNSLKYTNKGFIELSVSSMIKYDVCRLIISIEDSGIGMDIAKVNDLLEYDEEMSENDLKTLGKIDLNLNIVKKIIKYLGGSIMIKSEVGKGSEFIIVLDQKIDLNSNYNESDKYTSFVQKKTKVLLVDDNMEELSTIENILNKSNISYTSTTYSKDCLDKINNNYKYDIIIINDEMPEYSAYETLKKLKEIKGFNIPVVVILDKKKDFMKQHYIEDGFKDYILKEKLDREIKRVINKYL